MKLNEVLNLKFKDELMNGAIVLQDDGNGVYIKKWDLEEAMPNAEELNQWAVELDLQYRQQQAVAARIYPAIGAQLDMLYHDHKNNTTIWVDTIEAIKLANPKPAE